MGIYTKAVGSLFNIWTWPRKAWVWDQTSLYPARGATAQRLLKSVCAPYYLQLLTDCTPRLDSNLTSYPKLYCEIVLLKNRNHPQDSGHQNGTAQRRSDWKLESILSSHNNDICGVVKRQQIVIYEIHISEQIYFSMAYPSITVTKVFKCRGFIQYWYCFAVQGRGRIGVKYAYIIRSRSLNALS